MGKVTQEYIDAMATQIRAAGCPDDLNRWIGMTPDQLAESEARIASMVEADTKRRSHEMPKVGPKEAALREMSRSKAPPANKDDIPPPADKPAKKKAAKKKVAAPGNGGTAKRAGGKLDVIKKLLARKNGCTAQEVKDACEWPSVSMPQQAKALGVELHRKETEGQPMRYADHPLT